MGIKIHFINNTNYILQIGRGAIIKRLVTTDLKKALNRQKSTKQTNAVLNPRNIIKKKYVTKHF